MRRFERIIVTGAAGFIGSELVRLLLKEGYRVHAVDDLSKGRRDSLPEEGPSFTFTLADLRDRGASMRALSSCDWVIHLASKAYGVAYCSKRHASTFLLNCQINANVIEAVIENGVPGITGMSSSCVYSDDTPDGMTEDQGFAGEPETANWGYGWAKRMLEVGLLAAARDGHCEGIVVRPVNVYGPGYGWFGEYSHVIPTLVKKILDGENPLLIWGDGTQARSFLHVRDVARALTELSLHAPNGTVVNLGDEEATTINEIAQLLQEVFGIRVPVTYDPTRPSGRKVKNVSSRRLKEILPWFQETVPMRRGLAEMASWYERHMTLGTFAHTGNQHVNE
jgi:nucleoside-diphosphate-sugar epimerase